MTDNSKKPPQVAEQDYSHRCLTCRHWEGDKDKQWEMIEQSGHVVMALRGCWYPQYGGCGIWHISIDMTINGNASADLEFAANFGCVHWQIEDKND